MSTRFVFLASKSPRRSELLRQIGVELKDYFTGLIDFHTHRQSDFMEQQNRSYLAYGITTIRN